MRGETPDQEGKNPFRQVEKNNYIKKRRLKCEDSNQEEAKIRAHCCYDNIDGMDFMIRICAKIKDFSMEV